MKKEKPRGRGDSTLTESNRAEERQSEFRAADLVLDEDRAPVSCLVKDISKTGLRLFYESPHELPARMKVVLHHPNQAFECELVWQNDTEIGLKILEDA